MKKKVEGAKADAESRLVACTVVQAVVYKPWAKSMGEGDFRPPTAPRPLDRFS